MHGAKGTWVPLSWGTGRAWQALARPVQLVAAPAGEGVGTRGQGLKQGLHPCHLMVPAPHHPTVPALRERRGLRFPSSGGTPWINEPPKSDWQIDFWHQSIHQSTKG